jgi:nucleoside diphosphate kinase
VCLLQVWEGDGVVASARKMIGATNPLQAEPGTIRGDFAIQVGAAVDYCAFCIHVVDAAATTC